MGFISSKKGLKIPVLNTDPSLPKNGEIWYAKDLDAFRVREDGVTRSLTEKESAIEIILPDGEETEILRYPSEFRAAVVKYSSERGAYTEAGNMQIIVSSNQAMHSISCLRDHDMGITYSTELDGFEVVLKATTNTISLGARFKFLLRRW